MTQFQMRHDNNGRLSTKDKLRNPNLKLPLVSDLLSRSRSAYLKKKIDDLDLEPIKFKMVKEKGWTIENVDRVEPLYKGFLFFNAVDPDSIHVPTEEIDEMWHNHVLDTRKYMADCHEIFGRYLHHYPYLGMRDEADAKRLADGFARTREKFATVLGLDIVKANADCGGCGGSSCGTASCGNAPDSGGDGGWGIFNIIASCGSDSPAPSKKEPDRQKRKDEKPSRPLWQRILGLQSSQWQISVDPRRMRIDGRPGRSQLEKLAAGGKETLH